MRLIDALITEHMKPDIAEACPNIQIGGMPERSKTWMKMKEEKKENEIFQVFDMAKFFDKESLLDTLYTLHKEAKICDKDYRI